MRLKVSCTLVVKVPESTLSDLLNSVRNVEAQSVDEVCDKKRKSLK